MSRIDPQDSRQGRRGLHVLKILIATLVLCLIAGIGISFYGFSMPDQTLTNASSTAGPVTTSATSGSGTTADPSTPTAK